MNKRVVFPSQGQAIKDFKKIFDVTARYHHRLEVFRDFVTVSAIALSNGISFSQTREDEYLRIAGRYQKEDVQRICEMFSIVVMALEVGPEDFLGPLFMDLELGDARKGQFFTPSHVSRLMAEISLPLDLTKYFETHPFLTVSEPAAGSGGMILPLVDRLISAGFSPQKRLFVQAVDCH